jgi:hypothetical protein
VEFVSGLQVIASLLEHREVPVDFAAGGADGVEENAQSRPPIDSARFRFSVKLAGAITLGLLVGLTTQRADLQTILWSIAVAGQPNQYGAILRKTLLRLAGCIMGGLAALGAMLIVSQNFDSLEAYAAAIFAVTILGTYIAQSSEWLGYAGIQAGITFVICYVGLGPSSDIYRPLWRFWGIVLGVLTTGFVFLVLWPEYASDKLIEPLAELVRTTLAFGRQVADGKISERMIAAAERSLSAKLLEALEMADQARLEGWHGRARSAAAIDAADALIRIAYRFRVIALGRMFDSDATLPPGVKESWNELEYEYCSELESELQKLETGGYSKEPKPSEAAQQLSALSPVNQERVIGDTPDGSERSAYVYREESYRRLPVLLAQLDAALSRIANS